MMMLRCLWLEEEVEVYTTPNTSNSKLLLQPQAADDAEKLLVSEEEFGATQDQEGGDIVAVGGGDGRSHLTSSINNDGPVRSSS